MGNLKFNKLPNNNLLVQTIHAAVKGRARYKVNGLYGSEAFKRYLGFRLSNQEEIIQVRANHWTGNVLVIFHPDFSPSAIALLLQEIVLDYSKETRKSRLETDYISIRQEKAKNLLKQPYDKQLILIPGAICTFLLSIGLLHHRYGLDTSILLAIQKLHTPLLDHIILGITFLGEPLVLLLISLGLEFSLLYNRRPEATRLGFTTASVIGFNYLLKVLFGRARPALWDHIVDVGHYSFPSGHAMVSIVIYGFISYILGKEFPEWRNQISALTVVLIMAIGFSRLYLGVHWPTDVLVGYAIGLVWLIACILKLEVSPSTAIATSLPVPVTRIQ